MNHTQLIARARDAARSAPNHDLLNELADALEAPTQPTLIDDPETDGTDFAHPAWWRGQDHALAMICHHVNLILDGKDDGSGENLEGPWRDLRRRLLALVKTTQPAPDVAELVAGAQRECAQKYLCSYYFSFSETGVGCIDEILSWIARAGKSYHHTEQWSDSEDGDPSKIDLIQSAANDAAKLINRLATTLTALHAQLQQAKSILAERGFDDPSIIESVKDVIALLNNEQGDIGIYQKRTADLSAQLQQERERREKAKWERDEAWGFVKDARLDRDIKIAETLEAEAERDAAIARAEAAEKQCNAMQAQSEHDMQALQSATARAEAAEAELAKVVERWQTASMLIGVPTGDPSTITPEILESFMQEATRKAQDADDAREQLMHAPLDPSCPAQDGTLLSGVRNLVAQANAMRNEIAKLGPVKEITENEALTGPCTIRRVLGGAA